MCRSWHVEGGRCCPRLQSRQPCSSRRPGCHCHRGSAGSRTSRPPATFSIPRMQALLAVGFTAPEFERLRRLLHEEMEAEMVKVGLGPGGYFAPRSAPAATAVGTANRTATWLVCVCGSGANSAGAPTALCPSQRALPHVPVATPGCSPVSLVQLVPASTAMLTGSLGAALEQDPVPQFEQVRRGRLAAARPPAVQRRLLSADAHPAHPVSRGV